jgi:hypothetical protein
MAEHERGHGLDTHARCDTASSSTRPWAGGPFAAVLAALVLACGQASNKGDSGGSAGATASSGGSEQQGSTGGTSGETGGAQTGGSASDPFAAAEKCTSGTSWTSGEGSTMRPGEACITCHSASGGPRFAVAGTVYPTGHEPDDCNGAGDTGAVVVITDADGQAHELSVNRAGNFTLSGTLALPFTAKVVVGSTERSMSSSQSTGDCNACHTQSGTNGAPGRVVLP